MNPFRTLAILMARYSFGPTEPKAFLEESEYDYFELYFRPLESERKRYDMWPTTWTSKIFGSHKENNEFRIMALLFCAEMWDEDVKTMEKTLNSKKFKKFKSQMSEDLSNHGIVSVKVKSRKAKLMAGHPMNADNQ